MVEIAAQKAWLQPEVIATLFMQIEELYSSFHNLTISSLKGCHQELHHTSDFLLAELV